MAGIFKPETLIFEKTKTWWGLLHKLHLSDERKRMNDKELIEVAKRMQEIEEVVMNIQLNYKIPLSNFVDFEKLKNKFFKMNRFAFGVPLKKRRKRYFESKNFNKKSNN